MIRSTDELKQLFLLDPNVTYLNFGSFGATPVPVFQKYQAFQRALETSPVQFITVRTPALLKVSREALAGFVHCHADDLVLVSNPSYAVNTIAKSLHLQPGDEILTTNLEYGACDRAWHLVCGQSQSRYIQQPVTLPLTDEDTFVDELFAGVTSRTKIIFISHITSTTALILPVKKVIEKAKTLGIPVFIDGAHAPGHIDLNLEDLNVDYYTGACHKWMMTPKGSSFMYVKKSLQCDIFPLIVSWGYEAAKPSHSRFLDWHEMSGTLDYSARLCIPEAIAFREKYHWNEVASDSRKLAYDNASTFAGILNSQLLAPIDERFIGQMISVPIRTDNPDLLYQTLVHGYKIEIPVMPHNDVVYLRYSINGFNSQHDLDRLYEAIKEIKKTGLLY